MAADPSATAADLEVFLGQDGCALCRQEAQTEQRFFAALLGEGVNTPATEAQMRASGGLCARHLGVLCALREPLATNILYRSLLLDRIRLLGRVAATRRALPRPGRRSPCPVCAAECESGARGAAVLAAALEDGRLRQAWRASAGLCWPHFALTRSRCRAAQALLDDVEQARLGALLSDVEALQASFDYRSDGHRAPAVESAWRRLLDAVGGRFPGGRTLTGDKPD